MSTTLSFVSVSFIGQQQEGKVAKALKHCAFCELSLTSAGSNSRPLVFSLDITV